MENHADKILIVIPTYNERQTLPALLARLRDHQGRVSVLIVDDSSPDGTGQWAASLGDERIHVMSRPAKSGLASAYLEGFAWGIERGFEYLVEMDADGSHRVVDLGLILDRAWRDDDPDLVIGSRWIAGGRTQGWAPHRIALSRLGNVYIRMMLKLKVGDATAGLRVYRRALAEQLIADGQVISRGYGFQVEMTWRARQLGATIVEVPIVFLERHAGVSKMDANIVVEELVNVTRWGVQDRLQRWFPKRLFPKHLFPKRLFPKRREG